MYSEKLQLSLVNTIKLRNLIDESQFTQGQAGFVKNGSYAWIVRESTLEILSTETGVKAAHYNFGKYHGSRGCLITCVEEVDYLPGVCLLAVATEFTTGGTSTSVVSIFCVQGSKILGSMDFCERITCCRFISKAACQRSVLRQYQGTIAVGTDQGKLFLIDLMIPSSLQEIASSPSYETELFPCTNILASVEQPQIAAAHRKLTSTDQQLPEKSFFSIQLDALNDSGAIVSILCMPNLYTMAVGLNDGRMVLYDLADLQAFHLAYPPNRAPLTHMSYLEPTDDPRCAIYIWAFHSSNEGAIAVMHSLMYASKINGVYEDFKSCSVRLTMPMYLKETYPICCHSIMKTLAQDDEDIITLNVLAWTTPTSRKTSIMIFDLNQWYKEEMPNVGDWRLKLKYVAVFELNNCASFDVIINDNSVFAFNSILRPEEHFYPNSLSFDVCVLENDKFAHYRWFGLQNIVLQQFNVIGPQIILEPSYYFNELLQVAIIPQFSDTNFGISTPIELKREFLLSVALEYNFNGFLRKCAWAWADGSYLGKDNTVGIGLSTLTDWIWSRARAIKDVCNSLCQPLFDYSEQRIDYGTQKQLSQCCKQLKTLSDLLIIVLKDCHKHIPDHIVVKLKTQSETIKMASDYQEVLQWLLNVGLLPEGHFDPQNRDQPFDDEFLIVPYPYETIRSFYDSQRMKLTDDWIDESRPQQSQENSCNLFIDAFIEQECKSEKLREIWNGIYPPSSIQALLRTLLVPDISISSKHVIFVYLFMDITNVLSEGSYSSIVRNLIKFPAVFKMNPAMIKRTQAFWNLDNGRLDTAVEELISPLSHDKHLPLWQRELLIGALLKQNANSLALRALRCPGNQISSDLEVFTLLSNNLMSEALKVQRASGNRKLLEKLFEKILHSPNYEQLLDLTLTEEEGIVLGEYLQKLKNSGLPNHLNIHFVFLLQRSKFLDAAQLVESLVNETNMNLEPPKQVLNAYYASMESTTRKLTSMIYAEDVQVKESPLPLSVNLIRSRCNAKNDIYQQCIQSITEAAYENSPDLTSCMPFLGSPKLGIFEYRQPAATYQEHSFEIEVNEHGKRKQVQKNEEVIRIEDFEAPLQKKRRLDDSIVARKKSYMEKRLNNLTMFKDTKPNFSFARKSANSSVRTTPERVQTFGNFLNTPVITKKTPIKAPEKCPPTPHSILKTRSCRGSVSPAPSRFSEFGDDNKSVKSITFAALPDSRDTSLNESSFMEESFNEEQMNSSAEPFYSPGKSPETNVAASSSQRVIGGPKMRKSIKSRSNSPAEQHSNAPALPPAQEKMETNANVMDDTRLNETVSSNDSNGFGKPFRDRSVLKDLSMSYDESDEESEKSAGDKSIYNYVRKSVLPDNIGEVSSSEEEKREVEPEKDEDSESDLDDIEDEHYEEEELPQHSDYDESSDPDAPQENYEYGDLDLNDTDESESRDRPAQINKPSRDEIICLDSSSSSSVEEEKVNLPSFGNLGSTEDNLPTSSDFAGLANLEQQNQNVQPEPQAEIFSLLYDNLDQEERMEVEEVPDVEIESPPYEEVVTTTEALPPFEQQYIHPISSTDEVEPLIFDFQAPSEILIQQDEVQENVESQECADNAKNEELVSSSQESENAAEREREAAGTPSFNIMSEECSFVSAMGGDLNEAIVHSQIIEESVKETEPEPESSEMVIDETNILEQAQIGANISDISEDDKPEPDTSEVSNETTNVFEQAHIGQDLSIEPEATASETLDTPNQSNISHANDDEKDVSVNKSEASPSPTTRTLRSRAGSSEPYERVSRASSVPSNSGRSSPRSRSQRASTEDRDNPSNILRVKTMERIEENITPVGSPGMLTRRRSQLIESGESPSTPLTPSRLTRARSHLSDEGKSSTPTTPTRRMLTRATSKESLMSESDRTPEEPGALKRTSSLRVIKKRTTSASADENDDAKSTRSTRSTRKKSETPSSTKVTPERESRSPSEPQEELSVGTRRLTRSQLQVLEKSRQLTEKIALGSLRATKSENIIKSKQDESDNESVKSESGSVASSRASRKRKPTKKTKDEDSKSVTSKSSRRTPSPKWNQLSIIPEESTEEPSDSASTSSRTRKGKK